MKITFVKLLGSAILGVNMKIVILTRSADRHYYFCNQIIEKTEKVTGVITGAKAVNQSRYENL